MNFWQQRGLNLHPLSHLKHEMGMVVLPTELLPTSLKIGISCAYLLFSLNNIFYICDFNNVSNNCSSTLMFSILKMNLQYTLYKVASFIMWFRGLVSVRCASAKRIWNHALNPINQTFLPHYWSHLTNWLFDINLFFSFFNFMFSKKAT